MWSWLDSHWPLVVVAEAWLIAWAWRWPSLPWPFDLHRQLPERGWGRPMRFDYCKLRYQPKDAVVRVRLHDTGANVRLLDARNFFWLKKGKKHRYLGNHYSTSPVHLTIPYNGKWFVTLDRQADGRIPSSVTVFAPNLPEGRPLPDLTSKSSLVRIKENFDQAAEEVPRTPQQRDVFVSYAREDGPEVAHPLAALLVDRGVSVWIDEYELKIGDSLRQKIDSGIASSRFGLVVLSPHFFRKGWTNAELDALLTREIDHDRQVVLPVWHRVTKTEVEGHSVLLARRIARSTSDYSLEEIAEEIAEVVRRGEADEDDNPPEAGEAA